MSLRSVMTGAGIPAHAAQAIQGRHVKTLTATGSTQGGALALPGDINYFSTVGSSTGAIIPAANGGDSGEVYNGGSNALSLYPPTGGTINGGSTNVAYSIATATPYCKWRCVDPLTYIAMQSA